MQTLAEAFYPIVGEKFPHWMGEGARAHNPLGYYESIETMRGLRGDIGSAAIKIMLPALLERSEIPQHATIILCTRDPEAMAQSQHRTNLNISGSYDIRLTREINARYYSLFWEWAKGRNVHVFHHEDWLANPHIQKARLLEVCR